VGSLAQDSSARGESQRWHVLSLLCLGIVLTLTTWFSAVAVNRELASAWELPLSATAWLSNGVQLGFVCGALAASIVNLPDILPLNRIMATSAAIAGVSNMLLLLEPDLSLAIALRIVTGVALAGVYPPALKLIATWFRHDRGLALGALIGALTLGSAMPHLFRAVFGTLEWKGVVIATSLSAWVGAAIFLMFGREGPYPFARATFEPRQVAKILRERPLFLANLGYFGHMWELYAMWVWLLVYVEAAFVRQGIASASFASLVTFIVIASGVVGCILGGLLSDRIGRTLTTFGMMAVSGICALLVGFAYAGPLWLFLLILLVWGIAIIGDSAQFSAAVSELSDQRFVGTALSLQLGIGFALTILAIWLTPRFAGFLGSWQWAFLLLVPGPVIGAFSMMLLRRDKASIKLATGKR